VVLAIDSLGDDWGSAGFVLAVLVIFAMVSVGLWRQTGEVEPKVAQVRNLLLPVFVSCTALLTVLFAWHVALAV
jgi:hypothetical protein